MEMFLCLIPHDLLDPCLLKIRSDGGVASGRGFSDQFLGESSQDDKTSLWT